MKFHKGKLIGGILLILVGFFGTIGGIGGISTGMENWAGTVITGIVCMAIGFFLVWLSSRPSKAAKAAANDIISQANAYFDEANAYYNQKRTEIDRYRNSLKQEISDLENQRDSLLAQSLVEDINLTDYQDMKSDEIKNELSMLRLRQSDMVKTGDAVDTNILSSSSKNKRLVTNQTKQLLRCFNAECTSIVDKVTVRNVDSSRDKIVRSFDTLNKMFKDDGVQLTQSFLKTKFEELSLAYSYLVKLEEEKEQRRAIREQMVEEEKVRKETERAKQKIEKEEAQFSNEINKLMAYMQNAKDEVERKLYVDKIQELQDKLSALQKDKENVLQREQNTRAGFVYIISNIGSFGEQVFKIGMTRRLEPMDRIAELSSASVPFPFDVHAMIFSEDAPHLETVLHQHFDKQRVNQVNSRKEFFKVDLEEIKKVVLENHNATVKFVDVPEAVEYRETMKLSTLSEQR